MIRHGAAGAGCRTAHCLSVVWPHTINNAASDEHWPWLLTTDILTSNHGARMVGRDNENLFAQKFFVILTAFFCFL